MSRRAAAFLRRHLGSRGALQLEPLAAGTSGRTHLASVGNDRFVLRDRAPDAATWRPGLATELTVWRAAAAAGFALPIVAADPVQGLVLAEYIEASPLAVDDLDQPAIWLRLHSLLQALQKLSSEGVAAYSPSRAVNHYEKLQSVACERALPHADELRALAAEFSSCHTVCHNDLVPANVLDDGKQLWLIDFEFAGCSVPALDWATLIVFGREPPPDFELDIPAPIMANAIRLVRLLGLAWFAALETTQPLNLEQRKLKARLVKDADSEG